ncbi:hypothetical protein [Actinomyces ruminis]|uniref:hypothetical protein n=1 Tax=Actinomyces ruminis TaxID=1937003 RepID=UPI00211DEEE8|nr:hypothetical protein [Actinomyces ruminis]
MSLNRRSFLSMTAIATTLAAAAACGSDDTSTATAASEAPVEATDESTDEQVVRDANADLVIWTDEVKAGALKDKAQEWGDAQGITVAVQVVADDLQGNFIAANQAGNGPDVVWPPTTGSATWSRTAPSPPLPLIPPPRPTTARSP